ncbi:MAG: nucleotidyl transferase AbiEii/AbiGii toxin family protein [Prolixibacteraceae bacterium]|nr:nucleotidyl transferase AbiEii/AbiGii toxin family protein [Prolixibacteraceae bacterium]
MIPANEIKAWSNVVPWITDEQIEQDLVICRALVEIFSNEFLAENLVFRGGTALHKLYLQPQPRYSEDIDLVQKKAGPIKEIIVQLQKCMLFLGEPTIKQKANNNTLVYRFNSESVTPVSLRLKIEINCREHFSVLGYTTKDFGVNTGWFKGSCNIQTYQLEEMIGTKVRALYQRRKGRDLYDLYKAMTLANLNIEQVITCYHEYMKFVVDNPPTQKQFLQNMELKMKDREFLDDTVSLLRVEEKYDYEKAYELIKTSLLEII